MKRICLSVLALSAATLWTFGAMAQTVELRLAHGSPRGHQNAMHADMLAEKINEISGGDVKVTVYGDRQLGDDADMIQLVQSGTVDMAYASSVNFPLTLNKVAFDALQLPGLASSYEHLGRMLGSEPAIAMLDSLEGDGLKGLCYSEGGLRHFLNKAKPIKTVEDFKGLKTRIVPIPLHRAIWQHLGANPVGVPYGEVYTAMQTNVIDAVEFNASSINADKIYENAKYLTLTAHYFWPGLFFMNKAKYDSLPPKAQEAIVKSCRELVPAFMETAAEAEGVLLDKLRAAGVEVHEFTDRPALLEKTKPVFDEWSGKDPLIGKFIAEAKELE
ncbi:TRAP transporter substrate-binding protein [Rhodoligotrophos defluvii]|uniref:TRAP transporter substrate-binding protein n=1 Tax=Rhodoligotrophos defluvii TaxID=2561934 RepID=UPI0010C983F1|nr:TRAP transporter substrate-binding protein [Rhodoligotrophos defluvii]